MPASPQPSADGTPLGAPDLAALLAALDGWPLPLTAQDHDCRAAAAAIRALVARLTLILEITWMVEVGDLPPDRPWVHVQNVCRAALGERYIGAVPLTLQGIREACGG